MIEQLVNLTEENNFIINTSKWEDHSTRLSLSNATSYLANPNTIANYYKKPILETLGRHMLPMMIVAERALKSVKKVGDSWRLKLQLSKYPHPLFVDDTDAEHECFLFDTQEEALQGFEDWIYQLECRERGILRAVKSAYQRYCKSNDDVEYDERAKAFFQDKSGGGVMSSPENMTEAVEQKLPK